jgi:acetyl-CoA C-acetyltransferase
MKSAFIVSASRTPVGSFGGSISGIPATQLGAAAIKGAAQKLNLNPELVDEVFMGQVVQANCGQAPARQAALYAGLSASTPCTTVNKVCASGMKSIMLGAQSIQNADNQVVIAGGMENMSSIPYYLSKARYGYNYGHGELTDGLVKDGLTDVYHGNAMGCFADATAEKFQISREAQDNFAINSYKKSAHAWERNYFNEEVVAVEIKDRKGNISLFKEDEEYKNVFFDKIPNLKPVFTKDGTVTAANASTINDGAAALVLANEDQITHHSWQPMSRIISFADASQAPEWFTTAPVLAAQKALKKAGLTIGDIDFFEVNEAFSVVTLAFMQELRISEEKVNIWGGAVSLGHPLGCSGARIVCTLAHILRQNKARYGLAAICNGGGGASAIIIENMP